MNTKWSSLGGVLVGAGLMFLLDPASGTRRRKVVRDRATSMIRRARHQAIEGTRDLTHMARDLEAQGDGVVLSETDRLVSERVRSRLGHLVRNARAVGVAVKDGRLTLSGNIDRDRVDGLLSELARVPGVVHVENLLQTEPAPRRAERQVGRLRRVLQRVATPRVGAASTLSALIAAYGWSRLQHAIRSRHAPAGQPMAREIGF